MKALLMVDIQNDFLPGGALPVPEGDLIIPIVNRIQEYFDLILASKDWHPPKHCSFASTYGKNPGESVHIGTTPQMLWPDHCVQHSWGAQFPSSLKTEKIAQVFYKGTDPHVDSYSVFFDQKQKQATELVSYLEQKGIKNLFIVGLATDYCVKDTALDARKLFLKTTLIVDGCRGVEKETQKQALEQMQQAGVLLTTSAEFLQGFSSV